MEDVVIGTLGDRRWKRLFEIELAVAIEFIVNFRLTFARTACGNGMISGARTAMAGRSKRSRRHHCTPHARLANHAADIV
jgi:hypothetical protein